MAALPFFLLGQCVAFRMAAMAYTTPVLVDIHTHSSEKRAGVLALRSLRFDSEVPASGGTCSLGIHPWDAQEAHVGDKLDRLNRLAHSDGVLALGECGVDRAIATPVAQQLRVFEAQVAMAEDAGKPLVLHCVRAVADLLAVHRRLRPAMPWILHGFSGNVDTAAQCLRAGWYLSFGAALLEQRPRLIEAFRSIPLDRVLIESDERPDVLRDVYHAAAAMHGLSIEAFAARVYGNAVALFPLLRKDTHT